MTYDCAHCHHTTEFGEASVYAICPNCGRLGETHAMPEHIPSHQEREDAHYGRMVNNPPLSPERERRLDGIVHRGTDE